MVCAAPCAPLSTLGRAAAVAAEHGCLDHARARGASGPAGPGLRSGTADLELVLELPGNTDFIRGGCIANFDGDVDVSLTQIGSVGQVAYTPGDRVAISAAASLVNVGTADVAWYRPIGPEPILTVGQHPYLTLHFYRISNGIIEQLGQSDLKHAFFSINELCGCPPDQILYVGCGDTYGANTNRDRWHLAPRDEVTAHTGVWEVVGSHFDSDPLDGERSHGGDGVHDAFEHRLAVQEADLLTPGAD